MTDDEALLGVVSSANVACGGHAGDGSTMRHVSRAARRRGVAVGAHVSYEDKPGFGRRAMDMDAGELEDLVLAQLATLTGIAAAEGWAVSYCKPHGALYNTIVRDRAQARAVAAAVAALHPGLPVLGLPGSVWLQELAETGLRPVTEVFADRAYAPDGSLVPRGRPGAVLHDPAEITARAVRMVTEQQVTACDGTDIPLVPQSICVHGDNPSALEAATSVRAGLQDAGVTIAPFTSTPTP